MANYRAEVLIVDDDPASLELLSGLLTTHRYNVRVANNGQRAIMAVQSSLPDLVLLDVNMPGMNGYEVCRRLKANPNTQEIPVIFLSASDDAFNKVEAFEAGASDYVTKPFQITEVVARMEAHVKVMRLSRELQMHMLRYQLNPHFLFNALISVRSLISLDGLAAEKMVTQLAEYLHYLLSVRDRLNIPVSEELEAVQNYLAIEQIRFQEKLNIRIDIDPNINSYCMLSFLLQPLLENAIKYGMKASSMPLEIDFSAQLKKEKLYFKVANTGNWIIVDADNVVKTDSLGVGLQNIRQRLRQYYPGRHSFIISEVKGNEAQGRVEVILEIPISHDC